MELVVLQTGGDHFPIFGAIFLLLLVLVVSLLQAVLAGVLSLVVSSVTDYWLFPQRWIDRNRRATASAQAIGMGGLTVLVVLGQVVTPVVVPFAMLAPAELLPLLAPLSTLPLFGSILYLKTARSVVDWRSSPAVRRATIACLGQFVSLLVAVSPLTLVLLQLN